VLTIDRKQAPEFADFLLGKAKELYVEFEQTKSGT
jgi:hypothetical protein